MSKRVPQKGSSEERLLAQVEKGPLLPFYVLFGPERFFIRKAVTLLKQRVLTSPDMEELLLSSCYASDTDPEHLLNLAQTVPFFDQTQLILVWEAEKLRNRAHEALLPYVENPSPSTCMVFVAGGEYPKNALFKSLQSLHPDSSMGFTRLKRPVRLKWLKRMAEEKGVGGHLPAGYFEGLTAAGQEDLEVFDNQLEMLSIYLEGQAGADVAEALSFLFSEVSTEQGYLLTDALLAGQRQKTLVFLNRFMEQGVAPLILLTRVAWEVRKLWQLRETMEKGGDLESVLKANRIPPFKKNNYIGLSRRVPAAKLKEMFFILQRMDRKLKSSRLDARWHLEELCTEVMDRLHPGPGARTLSG